MDKIKTITNVEATMYVDILKKKYGIDRLAKALDIEMTEFFAGINEEIEKRSTIK